MLPFCLFAACIPAQAEALNDRSLMPPISVTMQACVAFPPPGAPLAPLLLAGGLPQAPAASTRPPTALPPTTPTPRPGRKPPPLPLRHRVIAVVPNDREVPPQG